MKRLNKFLIGLASVSSAMTPVICSTSCSKVNVTLTNSIIKQSIPGGGALFQLNFNQAIKSSEAESTVSRPYIKIVNINIYDCNGNVRHSEGEHHILECNADFNNGEKTAKVNIYPNEVTRVYFYNVKKVTFDFHIRWITHKWDVDPNIEHPDWEEKLNAEILYDDPIKLTSSKHIDLIPGVNWGFMYFEVNAAISEGYQLQFEVKNLDPELEQYDSPSFEQYGNLITCKICVAPKIDTTINYLNRHFDLYVSCVDTNHIPLWATTFNDFTLSFYASHMNRSTFMAVNFKAKELWDYAQHRPSESGSKATIQMGFYNPPKSYDTSNVYVWLPDGLPGPAETFSYETKYDPASGNIQITLFMKLYSGASSLFDHVAVDVLVIAEDGSWYHLQKVIIRVE